MAGFAFRAKHDAVEKAVQEMANAALRLTEIDGLAVSKVSHQELAGASSLHLKSGLDHHRDNSASSKTIEDKLSFLKTFLQVNPLFTLRFGARWPVLPIIRDDSRLDQKSPLVVWYLRKTIPLLHFRPGAWHRAWVRAPFRRSNSRTSNLNRTHILRPASSHAGMTEAKEKPESLTARGAISQHFRPALSAVSTQA